MGLHHSLESLRLLGLLYSCLSGSINNDLWFATKVDSYKPLGTGCLDDCEFSVHLDILWLYTVIQLHSDLISA